MAMMMKMTRRISLAAWLFLTLACCNFTIAVVSATDSHNGQDDGSRTVSTRRSLRQRKNTVTDDIAAVKPADSSNAASPHRQLDSVSYCVEEEAVLERCIGRVSTLQRYDCKACVVTAYLGAGLCDEATTESTCRELQACDRRCRGCDTEVQNWAACEIDVVRGSPSDSCPSFVCGPAPPAPATPSPTNPTPPVGDVVGGRVDNSDVVIDSTLVIAPNPPAPTFPPFVDMTGSMVDGTTSPASVPVTVPSLAPTAITDAPTTTAPVVPAMDDGTGDGDVNLPPTLPPAFTTILVGTAECESVEMGLKQCLVDGFMMSEVQADFCARCVLTASSTPQVTDTTLACDESNLAACSGYTGCSTCTFPDFVCWKQMVTYGSCEAESLRQTTQQIECPLVNTTCPWPGM